MENKKQPLTHQLIVTRYKEIYLSREVRIAIPVVLILLLASYFVYRMQAVSDQKSVLPFGVFFGILVLGTAVCAYFEYRKYAKIKNGEYEITTDHFEKITKPLINPIQYWYVSKYTRFFQFRNYGPYPIDHFGVNKNRSENEHEEYQYYKNAQPGDQFYLVLVNGKAIQIYNAKAYRLPENAEE